LLWDLDFHTCPAVNVVRLARVAEDAFRVLMFPLLACSLHLKKTPCLAFIAKKIMGPRNGGYDAVA